MTPTKAVILAGGSGTRLWPASRAARPKQFLAFGGGRTLLQRTWDHLRLCLPAADILVCAPAPYAGLITEQLPELLPEQLVVEPAPRGTGPASAYLAAWIRRRFGSVTVATLAADGWIERPEAFTEALRVAAAAVAAAPDAVVAIGVRPTRASPRFGYIHLGPAWANDSRVFEVEAFTEKPDRGTAEAWLAAGNTLWNASYYVWKPDRLLALFAGHRPETRDAVEALVDAGERDADAVQLYEQLPRLSVDRAVMERARPMLAVPADMGWTDLGTWDAVAAVFPEGFPGPGGQVSVPARRVWVLGGDRLVATLGLEDVAVIETPDALLVIRLDQAERLTDLVDALRKAGYDDLT